MVLDGATQAGDFASVREQAGIFAGAGGYDVRVKGATALTGAVIASTAEADRNSLTTGSLTATDLANRESYRASQTNLGIGLGANLSKDRTGGINTSGDGTRLPGIGTPLGTLSATPPIAMSADGSQSSVTRSAIAPGGIAITGGDAASLATAASISRDPASANAGALTAEYTDARRAEIAQGFEATRQLTSEVGTFFANRGREEEALRDKAKAAAEQGDIATAVRLNGEATTLRDTYGSGSAARLVATALTGAVGSNVTGSLGGLVRASAVNVLQGLATSEVKKIADSLWGGETNRETARAALQAVVGCAGSAAGGSGNCGSAAVGAAASVVINNLISGFGQTELADRDGDGKLDSATLNEQQARSDFVATLVAGIASGSGIDVASATLGAKLETENNRDLVSNGVRIIDTVVKPGATQQDFVRSVEAFKRAEPGNWRKALALFGGSEAGLLEYLASPEVGKSIADASIAYRSEALDIISRGNAGQRAALEAQLSTGAISPTELTARRNATLAFDRLPAETKAYIRAELASASASDPNLLTRLGVKAIDATLGPDDQLEMAFLAYSFRSNASNFAGGAYDRLGTTLAPIGSYLSDAAILSSVVDANGNISPYSLTPDGQKAIAAANARMAVRGQTVATLLGNAAASTAEFAAAFAPPPNVNPSTGVAYRALTAAEMGEERAKPRSRRSI